MSGVVLDTGALIAVGRGDRAIAVLFAEARRVGLLLAASSTNDVVDGHVALCALRTDRPVLTSDPDAIGRLVPGVDVRPI